MFNPLEISEWKKNTEDPAKLCALRAGEHGGGCRSAGLLRTLAINFYAMDWHNTCSFFFSHIVVVLI